MSLKNRVYTNYTKKGYTYDWNEFYQRVYEQIFEFIQEYNLFFCTRDEIINKMNEYNFNNINYLKYKENFFRLIINDIIINNKELFIIAGSKDETL